MTAVARFGEPIYPTLEHLGSVDGAGSDRPADDDRPRHMVIESENYHALQLLVQLYERQVDCIYIDPPYNSGATDWKYNNRYVDEDDTYRHSKWLSMMKKRLVLARRLLKPDSVLVVTIDEKEVHRLALLLEQIFRGATIQTVTAVINPGGSERSYFTRVHEYLLFCFLGDAGVCQVPDNYLTEPGKRKSPTWRTFVRAGSGAKPSDRPNMVYPIGFNPKNFHIMGTGDSLDDRIKDGSLPFNRSDSARLNGWQPPPDETVNGFPVIWPHQKDGRLGRWQYNAEGLKSALLPKGYLRVRLGKGAHKGKWITSFLNEKIQTAIEFGEIEVFGRDNSGSVIIEGDARLDSTPKTVLDSKPKTVWNRKRHNAGTHGSVMLAKILGEKRFDFPKSVYAVRDTLLPIVKENPDALIVDFFAGSGTTLHATLLLNALDGGSRSCILVTNNEIGPDNEANLTERGFTSNDEVWQKSGIFEAVTRPRVEAAITGRRADGTSLSDKYLGTGVKLSDGFDAAAEFYRLRYLDSAAVRFGDEFDALHPLMWASAGRVGACPSQRIPADVYQEPGYVLPGQHGIPAVAKYAVLLRESRCGFFLDALGSHEQVTHVWLRADSTEAFADMRQKILVRLLRRDLHVFHLYMHYLGGAEAITGDFG